MAFVVWPLGYSKTNIPGSVLEKILTGGLCLLLVSEICNLLFFFGGERG